MRDVSKREASKPDDSDILVYAYLRHAKDEEFKGMTIMEILEILWGRIAAEDNED